MEPHETTNAKLSSLQSPQEREFVEIGLKQGTSLIIARPYPYEKTDITKLSQKAE